MSQTQSQGTLSLVKPLTGLSVQQLIFKLLSFGWVLEHTREILGRSAFKGPHCKDEQNPTSSETFSWYANTWQIS